jgi:hypothetical protein
MGPFPRFLLGACLNLMKWLFFVTAGLLAVLIVVQQLRGDAEAAPAQLALFALIMAALGVVSGKVSRWFLPQD